MRKSWTLIVVLLSIMTSTSSYSSQSEYSLYTIAPSGDKLSTVLWTVGTFDTEKLMALSQNQSAATGVDDSGVIRGYYNTCPKQLLFSQQKPNIVARDESALSLDICPSYDDGYVIVKKTNGLTTACNFFNRNQHRLVTGLFHALVQPSSPDPLSLESQSFDIIFKDNVAQVNPELNSLKVSISFSNGRVFITSPHGNGWGEYDIMRSDASVTFTGLIERVRNQPPIVIKGSYDGDKLFNVTLKWQERGELKEYRY